MAVDLTADYNVVAAHDQKLLEYLSGRQSPTDLERDELDRLKDLIKERSRPVLMPLEDDEVAVEATGIPSPDLIIREINFRPSDPDCVEQAAGFVKSDFEFVSLLNDTGGPINTHGLFFDSGFDAVLPDMTMEAGQLLVISKSNAAMKERYVFPDKTMFFEYPDANLAKNGERLRLMRRTQEEVVEVVDFVYRGEWLESTAGAGSLVNMLALPEIKAAITSKAVSEALTSVDYKGTFDADTIRENMDLSVPSSWRPSKPLERDGSARDLVPSFVMFNAPKGKKHDFVLLENIGNVTLSLDGLRSLGAPLGGDVEPNGQVVLAQDAPAFRSDFPGFRGPIFPYAKKLADDKDEFKLSCAEESLKAVWKYNYLATDWTPAVRGGGLGLKPANICRIGAERMSIPKWEAALPLPLARNQSCSFSTLGSCGGHVPGERWTTAIRNGTVDFQCGILDGQPEATYLGTTCSDGTHPLATVLTCTR